MQMIGIDYLFVSDDVYHFGEDAENFAKYAYQAAKELDFTVGTIELEDTRQYSTDIEWKGKPGACLVDKPCRRQSGRYFGQRRESFYRETNSQQRR